jgi:hypothetical protein
MRKGLRNRVGTVLPLIGAAVVTFGVMGLGHGAEFRRANPLPTPELLQQGAAEVARTIEPVSRKRVEAAIRRVFDSYNDMSPAQLEAVLAKSFYDRTRLVDNLVDSLPRDAKLRVLGIGSIQTLEQTIDVTPDDQQTRISVVTATVRSQLEFNDPVSGFTRLDGTNEYLLRIKEPLR